MGMATVSHVHGVNGGYETLNKHLLVSRFRTRQVVHDLVGLVHPCDRDAGLGSHACWNRDSGGLGERE